MGQRYLKLIGNKKQHLLVTNLFCVEQNLHLLGRTLLFPACYHNPNPNPKPKPNPNPNPNPHPYPTRKTVGCYCTVMLCAQTFATTVCISWMYTILILGVFTLQMVICTGTETDQHKSDPTTWGVKPQCP